MKFMIRIFKVFFFSVIILLIFYFVMGFFFGGGFGPKTLATTDFDDSKYWLFAHRGVDFDHPENSKGAINDAKNRGFKAIEIDVSYNFEGELFLFHDDTCGRLLNLPGMFYDLSYNEIKNQHLVKNDTVTEFKVLTLDECLQEFGDDLIFYVDLKLRNVARFITVSAKLNKILQKHDCFNSTFISSANPIFITYVEMFHPQINTILEGFGKSDEWFFYKIPKNFRPDYIASFVQKVEPDHINWLNENNLLRRRMAYTVRSKTFQSMEEQGIKKMVVRYGPYLDKYLTENQ